MANFDNKYCNNNGFRVGSTGPATVPIRISGNSNGYGKVGLSSASWFGSAPGELRLWSSPLQVQNYDSHHRPYELGAGDLAAIRQLYNTNRAETVQEPAAPPYPSSSGLPETAARRYEATVSAASVSVLRGFPTVEAAMASGHHIREIGYGYDINAMGKSQIINDYGITAGSAATVINEHQLSGDDNTALQISDSNDGLMMRSMKKRKLSEEQARRLEASFEADRKLEGEKKQKLAEELGLDARQIAVWFQNRRARSKTKQLEHDFVALQASYRDVLAQRQYLRDQIAKLTSQLQAKHGEVDSTSRSPSSTNSSNDDLKLGSAHLHENTQSITNKNFKEMSANMHSNTNTCNDSIGQVENTTKPTTMNHSEAWKSYDDNLWVFD